LRGHERTFGAEEVSGEIVLVKVGCALGHADQTAG